MTGVAASCPLENVAYVYDGTTEGLFTAIFKAYENHEDPQDVVREGTLQPRLGQSVKHIDAEAALAARVGAGIERVCGAQGLNACIRASLSDDPDAGSVVYRFVRYAMSREKARKGTQRACEKEAKSAARKKTHHGSALPDHCASNQPLASHDAPRLRRFGNDTGQNPAKYRGILGEIANPEVAPLLALEKSVMNERHLMQQFMRFEQLEGGVWFARCSPEAAVVPLLMDWFSGRFNTQRFAIYDEAHHMAGIYEGGGWHIVRTDQVTLPEKTESEAAMQRAWKRFYDTVSIDARYHPELRVHFMPKRFWKNLPEMDEAPYGCSTPSKSNCGMKLSSAAPPSCQKYSSIPSESAKSSSSS